MAQQVLAFRVPRLATGADPIPLTFHDPSPSYLPAAHSVGDDGAVGVFLTCKPAKD